MAGSSPAREGTGNKNMDTPITRAEHEEFRRRMEDEHHRLSKRIATQEESLKQLNNLALSVNDLAVNMKNMIEEQRTQGEKLDMLEARDGEMWRKVVGHLITVCVGLLAGFIFTQLGMN